MLPTHSFLFIFSLNLYYRSFHIALKAPPLLTSATPTGPQAAREQGLHLIQSRGPRSGNWVCHQRAGGVKNQGVQVRWDPSEVPDFVPVCPQKWHALPEGTCHISGAPKLFISCPSHSEGKLYSSPLLLLSPILGMASFCSQSTCLSRSVLASWFKKSAKASAASRHFPLIL